MFRRLLLVWGFLILPFGAGASVLCVQENLAMFGYDPGPLDGIYGQRTIETLFGFNADYHAGLPRLSRSNSEQVCAEFIEFSKGAGGPVIPRENMLSTAETATDTAICYENPAEGTAMEVTGMVDGDLLTLRVSNRFAGSVDSVIWRGKEFINIYDHGRQISYAWFVDYYGECFAPTEPGNIRDEFKQTSTSELLNICSSGPNQVTTTTQMAYWMSPGRPGVCDNGTEVAFNTTDLSNDILRRSIEIGYGGIDNVIAFDATITTPEDHEYSMREIPTGYLTEEFTEYWRFDPGQDLLTKAEAADLVGPWSFVSTSKVPPIISTPDGEYAMGAYTAEDVSVYEILAYNVANPSDRTNKWNIVVEERPSPAGDHHYLTFVIVGTLIEVQAAMRELYLLHPTDFAPADGFIDVADCDIIAGWVWDPDVPNTPLLVEIYSVMPDGQDVLVGSVLADIYRQDLADVSVGNGRHSFDIATREIFPNGGEHVIRAEAVNTVENLSNHVLTPSQLRLSCP